MQRENIAEKAVNVYSLGVCKASVCAPADMTREDVELHVNEQEPTRIDSPWRVADEPFRTGEANPHLVPECGQHWLLEC